MKKENETNLKEYYKYVRCCSRCSIKYGTDSKVDSGLCPLHDPRVRSRWLHGKSRFQD